MVVSQSSNSCNYWKLIILKKVWPKFANNTITTKLILDSEPRADYVFKVGSSYSLPFKNVQYFINEGGFIIHASQ